jgi:arsenate reductase
MAEGLLRALGGDRYLAFSAGLIAAQDVDPMAVRVMAERGIDISGQEVKSLAAYQGHPDFHYVVTLCERAQRLCPRVRLAGRQLFWPLPDPAEFSGIEEIRLAKFRALRDALEMRVGLWLDQQGAIAGDEAVELVPEFAKLRAL